jgi:hypothetical protein
MKLKKEQTTSKTSIAGIYLQGMIAWKSIEMLHFSISSWFSSGRELQLQRASIKSQGHNLLPEKQIANNAEKSHVKTR